MKPLGIEMAIVEGEPSWQVTKSDKVSDLIWEAVEEAVRVGWSPEQFKTEISCAWQEALTDQIKDMQKVMK